ncbi:MAG: DUF433 domain-containing protein [Desulfobacteraceae bacterium]|nr:DUF433 domain-containing protein [Desulfobacteraceae bacterium]
MNVVLKTQATYPYISSDSNIAEGIPVIEGTRITVRCIAGYYQMGMSADDILTSLSHLTQSQVHAALVYYFDHREKIDSELAESSDENYWKQQVLSRDASNGKNTITSG